MTVYYTTEEAYKMLGYKNSASLRQALRQHIINGIKHGRDWFVTNTEIRRVWKVRGVPLPSTVPVVQ